VNNQSSNFEGINIILRELSRAVRQVNSLLETTIRGNEKVLFCLSKRSVLTLATSKVWVLCLIP
jgi:hypothetical protein